MKNEGKTWDEYWKKQYKKESLFGKLCSYFRVYIKANAVRYYLDKYFPSKGVFAECGSGSAETSIKINKRKRKIIAVDISSEALRRAKRVPQIDKTVKADIRKLPFKNQSIDGIWNLGVMEHFSQREINQILKEFGRVLKKNGVLILFWPPVYGLDHIVLVPIEFFVNLFRKKEFRFFPDEPSRLKSKNNAEKIMEKNGFNVKKIHFSPRNLFTELIVVCEKRK